MSWRRTLDVVAFAIGAIGLAFVLRELGWDGIEQAVVGTGWWFAVIAAVDVASVVCDAFAIHGFLRVQAPVSYARVFAAEASGLAINRLTPGNTLGEPVKVAMLSRHVAAADAVSAVMLFNVTTIFVAIAVIVIGVPLTALLSGLPRGAELAVWIASAALVALALVIAALVRRGAVGTFIDAVWRVRLISSARRERWREAVRSVDDQVRRLGGLGRGLAGVAGSRAFNMIGTVLVLHACEIPLTPALVIASVSVGQVVTWVSNLVPLGMGIADSANYVLYELLGATNRAGLVFTMVNRLRTCVLAGFGLLVLAIATALDHRNGRSTNV